MSDNINNYNIDTNSNQFNSLSQTSNITHELKSYSSTQVSNKNITSHSSNSQTKRRKTHKSLINMDSFTQMQMSSSESDDNNSEFQPTINVSKSNEKNQSSINLSVIHTPVYKCTRIDGKYLETRKHCPVCKKRVNTFCKHCSIALCFGTESTKISCWEKHHSTLNNV